MWQVAEGIHL